MRRSRCAFLVPMVLLASAAALRPCAAAKVTDLETPMTPFAGGCSLSQFTNVSQNFEPPFAIPDNNDALVEVGSLATPEDGSQVLEAVCQLIMAHTWVGDLELRLEYVDCTTGEVSRGVNLLCRPRGHNLLVPAPCGSGNSAGCSGNLGSDSLSSPPPSPVSYVFSDSADVPLADGVCPGVSPGGCYRPAPGNAMSAFIGAPLGGCWRLSVADWEPADVGVIASWLVWTRTGPLVAARRTSWGELKTIYR